MLDSPLFLDMMNTPHCYIIVLKVCEYPKYAVSLDSNSNCFTVILQCKKYIFEVCCVLTHNYSSHPQEKAHVYKLFTAHTPKAIVAIKPPNENKRIGASPPSRVVPTLSPTFLAYLLLGPEH